MGGYILFGETKIILIVTCMGRSKAPRVHLRHSLQEVNYMTNIER